jgi:hypothetical protein
MIQVDGALKVFRWFCASSDPNLLTALSRVTVDEVVN